MEKAIFVVILILFSSSIQYRWWIFYDNTGEVYR